MYEREQYLLLKDLPTDILGFLKEKPVSIAGGAINSVFTGRNIEDYDLCCMSYPVFKDATDFFEKNYWDNKVSDTVRAITYVIDGKKYQLLKRFTGRTLDILEKFDFTICKGLYAHCLSEPNWYFDPLFFPHIAQRRLVFNPFALSPIDSLIRIEKYKKRGYTISDLELLKIAMAIQKINIETYQDILNEIAGGSSSSTLEEISIEHPAEKYEFESFIKHMKEYEKAYYDMSYFLKYGESCPNSQIPIESNLPF